MFQKIRFWFHNKIIVNIKMFFRKRRAKNDIPGSYRDMTRHKLENVTTHKIKDEKTTTITYTDMSQKVEKIDELLAKYPKKKKKKK